MLIGEGGLSSSLTERLRASWLLSTNMFKNVCGKPLKSDNYAHAQQQLKGQSKQKYLSVIIYSPSSCSKPYFPLCNIKEDILKYVCNPIFWIPTFFFYVSSTEERKQYTFGMIWEWINDHFRVTIPLICFFLLHPPSAQGQGRNLQLSWCYQKDYRLHHGWPPHLCYGSRCQCSTCYGRPDGCEWVTEAGWRSTGTPY